MKKKREKFGYEFIIEEAVLLLMLFFLAGAERCGGQ